MLSDGHHGNTPMWRLPHADNTVWPRYPSSTDNRGNAFLHTCVCVCVHFSDWCKPSSGHTHTPRWKKIHEMSVWSRKSLAWVPRDSKCEEDETSRKGKQTQPGRPSNNRWLHTHTHTHTHTLFSTKMLAVCVYVVECVLDSCNCWDTLHVWRICCNSDASCEAVGVDWVLHGVSLLPRKISSDFFFSFPEPHWVSATLWDRAETSPGWLIGDPLASQREDYRLLHGMESWFLAFWQTHGKERLPEMNCPTAASLMCHSLGEPPQRAHITIFYWLQSNLESPARWQQPEWSVNGVCAGSRSTRVAFYRETKVIGENTLRE